MTKRVVSEDAAAPAALAAVAQLVERVLGKDEVTGPNPVSSSWLPEEGGQQGILISGIVFRWTNGPTRARVSTRII
jgi:hypothetical protein